MAPPASLPSRPLGKTGRQIPALGFGLMGLGVAYGYGGTDEGGSEEYLRRACKVAHVDAVQMEYNPWQLDIENAEGTHLLAAMRELGVSVFAYSPLGRGFLTGQLRSPDDFAADDFRRAIPRFSKENFAKNLAVVDRFRAMADKKGCTPGQLALVWLMAQGEDIIPIPGTKKVKYLEENIGAVRVQLSKEEEQEIRREIENAEVAGHRAPLAFLTEFTETVRS